MNEQQSGVSIRALTSEYFEAALELWKNTEHLSIRRGDTLEGLGAFVAHSPGCSFVAIDSSGLVGAVLCGHDTRRGYIYHLTVHPAHRRRGIGTRLLNAAMDGLAASGLHKGWAIVYRENPYLDKFWARCGWASRDDLHVFSELTGG